MSASSANAPQERPTNAGTSPIPFVLLCEGNTIRRFVLHKTPFYLGRKPDRDLVVSDPRVSREHAEIISENGDFYLIDSESRHGTYVNGDKVSRHKLQRNDRIELGVRGQWHILFNPERQDSGAAREFLSQMSEFRATSAASDLEKLTLFLHAARKLNSSGVLQEILVTVIETALRLTGAERGFIFLCESDGSLRLAAGRNAAGDVLADDKSISQSVLRDVIASGSEFAVTDVDDSGKLTGRESIVAFNLRTVIVLPLRKMQVQEKAAADGKAETEVRGALYLDSRTLSGRLTQVSHDILRTVATEAAALVENAYLTQAEERARRYQQELSIAASIQQRLMAVQIPEVPFAAVQGRSVACTQCGGDFYDVVVTPHGLATVVTDVSGKGISAALLASILQGMIYSQLVRGAPLAEIAAAANQFICQKMVGEKYATLCMAVLSPDGTLEYINCGHVPPLVVRGGAIVNPPNANLPIGLLTEALYDAGTLKLEPGDKLMVVTDGITEAEGPSGEFFGTERLEQVAAVDSTLEAIFAKVSEFAQDVPLADDCTVLELTYLG
jgi:phosphoserine phosphatase RsbU/P